MKVLMFGWEFPPHISGGLGTACYGITTGLLKEGINITFVVPRSYGDEEQGNMKLVDANDVITEASETLVKQWEEQIQVINVESTLTPYGPAEIHDISTETINREDTSVKNTGSRQWFAGGYGPNLSSEVEKYALIAEKIASEHEHDVIHAHDWLTFPAGIAASRISGKPLVVHVHATEYDRSGESINDYVYNIEKSGMENADHIIAVSEFTRQIIINKYGIDPNKISVAHNGITPRVKQISDLKKSAKEKVVTFMGRITYQKGPEYFIEAARKVLERYPDVRFVMAGSGDMLQKMIERVAELKLSSRFYFTGFLKGPEVEEMYALSDVYVMPSVSEPFGIAPLEAIQSNVPVIISRQSGVSEVLKHTIKVDFWDTDALADAISGLLQYKSLSDTFKTEGRNDLLKMKWENTAQKIKEIYQLVNQPQTQNI